MRRLLKHIANQCQTISIWGGSPVFIIEQPLAHCSSCTVLYAHQNCIQHSRLSWTLQDHLNYVLTQTILKLYPERLFVSSHRDHTILGLVLLLLDPGCQCCWFLYLMLFIASPSLRGNNKDCTLSMCSCSSSRGRPLPSEVQPFTQ